MRPRIAIAAALAAGAFGVTATAADAQGRGRNAVYGRPDDTPEVRAALAIRGFAACALDRVPASARKLLDAPIASAEEEKASKALYGVARECYRPEWPRQQSTTVRNALAEATYIEQHLAHAPDLSAVTAAPPASFAVVPAGTSGSQAQEAAWYLAALANCTAFAAPGPVREFIIGPIGVAEEAKRFEAIRPAFAKCGAGGAGDQIKPRLFRGYLAQALLSLSERKRPG